MKLIGPPGFRTDTPAFSAEPFYLYGENVRFTEGVPETIGLFAQVLDRHGGTPLRVNLTTPDNVTIYGDAHLILIGHGDTVTVYDWRAGTFANIRMPRAGTTGRWWFDTTETDIICGRANTDGKTFIINKIAQIAMVVPGAPDGGVAGGVLSHILVLAGADSWGKDNLADYDGDNKLIVRWSARRTDPSSAHPKTTPVGFEDWTPSDVNSSGEEPLENGSEIVGGGNTQFGFMIWTDTHVYAMTPRTDAFVFDIDEVGNRGLLSSGAWVESGNRVWWYDQARTLNVYDGGQTFQIPNPMRMASLEALNETQIDRCCMSTATEYGEVILHWPDQNGVMRELIYNYLQDAWYPWKLDRLHLTDRSGARPAIAVSEDGHLYAHDLRETLPEGYLKGAIPTRDNALRLREIALADAIEPFDFFFSYNMLVAPSVVRGSVRQTKAFINHLYARSFVPPGATRDKFKVNIRSYGHPSFDSPIAVEDEQELDLGWTEADFRVAGKAIRVTVYGEQITTFVRFKEVELEDDPFPPEK